MRTVPLLFLVLTILSLLSGCTPIPVEPEDALPTDLPFLPGLIANVSLPERRELNEEQVVYCYYSNEVEPSFRHFGLRVMSLDGSHVHDINQTLWSSSFGIDLGCWGEMTVNNDLGIPGTAVDFDYLRGLAWSPDGKRLLFGLDGPGNFIDAYISPDGSQQLSQEFLKLPRYTYYDFPHYPVWSPDGQWVAFIAKQTLTFPDVYVATTAGTDIKRLTTSAGLPGVAGRPVWSHDGSHLAYPLPLPDSGIGIIDIQSGTITEFGAATFAEVPQEITELHGITPTASIAWLPGDNLILFLTNSKSGDRDILWLMGTNDSHLTRLYEANFQQLALAPSGKQLTIVINEGDSYAIKSLALDASPQLETLLDTSTWGLGENEATIIKDIEWSPDGTRLIFASNPQGNFDLFVWDSISREVVQVSNESADEIMPRWRPRSEN
jgi:Tol biopolymer transport system component